MARQRSKQGVIIRLLGTAAHNNHHILRLPVCRQAETFTNQAFHPIAFMGALNLAFGDHQAKTGTGSGNITPQNGEIAIATFSFRGVKNGVKLARLRQP